jgi:cell division protein FtsL
MKARILLCLTTVIILSQSTTANADSGDREAILALMKKAFAAVRSSNPDDWRAIQLSEGTSLSFRRGPEDRPEDLEMRISNNEDFIADLKPDGHDYVERWTGEPTILIRGPIAVIWGEYEFSTDGVFSHCGVDSADLVKVGEEWKVANFMWTVEKDNCPTAPEL